MTVKLLPAFDDNYFFALIDGGEFVIVDPGDASVVLNFANKNDLKLKAIINTHHHWDHTGGNLELKQQFGCKVYCSEYDKNRIPGADHTLCDGDEFVFANHTAKVIEVPGHTLGHIAYHFAEQKLLFCGDTLFAMGCGRLFEGSPKQMFNSLNKLKELPADTQVYCAHEYTLSNAKFALTVEANNSDLQQRYREVVTARESGNFTVPTSIGQELKTNPFLRCQTADEFARIRQLKDQF